MTKHARLGVFCRVQWSRGLEKVPNTKNVPRWVHFLCSAPFQAPYSTEHDKTRPDGRILLCSVPLPSWVMSHHTRRTRKRAHLGAFSCLAPLPLHVPPQTRPLCHSPPAPCPLPATHNPSLPSLSHSPFSYFLFFFFLCSYTFIL